MKTLVPAEDDAPEFIAAVDRVLSGVVSSYGPPELYVIKISNWFSDRWLGFSGKALGAVGVSKRKNMTLPPFVPNRVVSERHFVLAQLGMTESHGFAPLHRSQPSSENLNRKLSVVAPDAALAWYSGQSAHAGQAALMCYLPWEGSHWAWYAGFAAEPSWHPSKCVEITPQELLRLQGAAF